MTHHRHPIAAVLPERAQLERQRDQLRHALSIGTMPCFVAHAESYLRRVEAALAKNTDMGLTSYAGLIGQWQHGVDDVCEALTGPFGGGQFARDVRAAELVL